MSAPAATRAATDPLRPLADLIAGIPRRFGVHPGLLVADRTGWLDAALLAESDSPYLDDLVESFRAHWNAPAHIGASFFWKQFGYWTTLPVALGWALNKRVPIADGVLLRREGVALEIGFEKLGTAVTADDPLVGHPDVVVVPDETALGTLTRSSLIERLHAPIAANLRRRHRIGERLLRGSVAEAVGHGILAFSGLPAAAAAASARALLDHTGLARLVEVGPSGVRRRTCCLAIALPGCDPCASCCLRR